MKDGTVHNRRIVVAVTSQQRAFLGLASCTRWNFMPFDLEGNVETTKSQKSRRTIPHDMQF